MLATGLRTRGVSILGEQLAGVRAVTFCSSKLPNRAPTGHVLMRAFFRPSAHELDTLSDTEWTQRAEAALATALPVVDAVFSAVTTRYTTRQRVPRARLIVLTH